MLSTADQATPDFQLVFDAQDSILLRSETVDLPLENQLRRCVIGECVCVCVILRVCVFVCEGDCMSWGLGYTG